MPRKHHLSSNLIKLTERRKGIGRDNIQIAGNRLTFMLYESSGTYTADRHTRRMLRKLHGI